jgi:hypothetical protein
MVKGWCSMKKRIELTTTEMQWIESALSLQMTAITKELNGVSEGSQIWQLLQLRFSNLEALSNKIHSKI